MENCGSAGLRNYLNSLNNEGGLSRIVFDEVHLTITASSWRFAMSYAYTVRQIAVPIVLLSATVPPKMESQLKVNYASNFVSIRSSTTCREEIMYSVVLREDQETMQEELINTLEAYIYASSCVIVYIQSRAWCEMFQEMFETKYPQAISCMYHATLTPEKKVTNQEAFMQETNKCKLMFATSAFAMGIDIPNIKAIINYGDMPDSLLDYAQASGRAKRDSNSFVGPAEATIITTLDSVDNFMEFRMRNVTKKDKKNKEQDLQEMKTYITVTDENFLKKLILTSSMHFKYRLPAVVGIFCRQS